MSNGVADAGAADGRGAEVGLMVSEELVAAFAALTGDRSSLHVNEAFARRSQYRRPVVHGMLPVAFLPLVPALRLAGQCCVPTALTGRFLSPAFIGDALKIRVAEMTTDGSGEVVAPFRIVQQGSGAVVTEGELKAVYRPASERSVAAADGQEAGMLLDALRVSEYQLSDISKGMTDRFAFRITGRTIAAYRDLLATGAGAESQGAADRVAQDVRLENLLAMLAFSTSIGVTLPGAAATFLEFSGEVAKDIELDTAYVMEGVVTHRSLGTRIVRKQVAVQRSGAPDEVAVKGRLAALMAEPARSMPGLAELRATALDPGLAGRVAVVTGASRGIGETIAKLFALHGARVVVNYFRGAADAERVVGEITAGGGEAVAVAADVSRPEQVEALFGAALERFGRVDVLVNNAARDFRPIPFGQLTWEEVQRDIDVIAKGAFLCCQRAVPLMLAQGGGKIVNISTVAVDDPPADQTKYVMAKAALVGLTRSLSRELAARNIQVNMVVPNFVETDLVAHVPEGFRKRIAEATPMGRNASPVDVAQAVVFLASSFASFTTGQKIMVTGGGAPYA